MSEAMSLEPPEYYSFNGCIEVVPAEESNMSVNQEVIEPLKRREMQKLSYMNLFFLSVQCSYGFNVFRVFQKVFQ